MINPPERTGLKLIVMDDKADWCDTISQTASLLGHSADAVMTLVEARQKIQEAYNEGDPYDLIVIDLNFDVGETAMQVPRGKEILHFVKTRHPYMACLILSGVSIFASEVLDLRDDNNLDYFMQKDQFDIDTFSRAVSRSMQHLQSQLHTQKPRVTQTGRLENVLLKWEGVRNVLYSDLATVHERAALKGIDVDVATKNEIEQYDKQIQKVERTIARLERALKGDDE